MSDMTPDTPPSEPMAPIQSWEERENGFGVKALGEAGTDKWEPEDDGEIPPGRLPYISIGVARQLVGDPIPPRRNINDAVALKENLRDMIAKRAMVRIHLRNLNVRAAGLIARIHSLASQKAQTGLWARYMECLSAQTKLLSVDTNLTNEIVATATACGLDTGALQTPEEAIRSAKPTVTDSGPKRLPKARRGGNDVIDVNPDDA